MPQPKKPQQKQINPRDIQWWTSSESLFSTFQKIILLKKGTWLKVNHSTSIFYYKEAFLFNSSNGVAHASGSLGVGGEQLPSHMIVELRGLFQFMPQQTEYAAPKILMATHFEFNTKNYAPDTIVDLARNNFPMPIPPIHERIELFESVDGLNFFILRTSSQFPTVIEVKLAVDPNHRHIIKHIEESGGSKLEINEQHNNVKKTAAIFFHNQDWLIWSDVVLSDPNIPGTQLWARLGSKKTLDNNDFVISEGTFRYSTRESIYRLSSGKMNLYFILPPSAPRSLTLEQSPYFETFNTLDTPFFFLKKTRTIDQILEGNQFHGQFHESAYEYEIKETFDKGTVVGVTEKFRKKTGILWYEEQINNTKYAFALRSPEVIPYVFSNERGWEPQVWAEFLPSINGSQLHTVLTNSLSRPLLINICRSTQTSTAHTEHEFLLFTKAIGPFKEETVSSPFDFRLVPFESLITWIDSCYRHLHEKAGDTPLTQALFWFKEFLRGQLSQEKIRKNSLFNTPFQQCFPEIYKKIKPNKENYLSSKELQELSADLIPYVYWMFARVMTIYSLESTNTHFTRLAEGIESFRQNISSIITRTLQEETEARLGISQMSMTNMKEWSNEHQKFHRQKIIEREALERAPLTAQHQSLQEQYRAALQQKEDAQASINALLKEEEEGRITIHREQEVYRKPLVTDERKAYTAWTRLFNEISTLAQTESRVRPNVTTHEARERGHLMFASQTEKKSIEQDALFQLETSTRRTLWTTAQQPIFRLQQHSFFFLESEQRRHLTKMKNREFLLLSSIYRKETQIFSIKELVPALPNILLESISHDTDMSHLGLILYRIELMSYLTHYGFTFDADSLNLRHRKPSLLRTFSNEKAPINCFGNHVERVVLREAGPAWRFHLRGGALDLSKVEQEILDCFDTTERRQYRSALSSPEIKALFCEKVRILYNAYIPDTASSNHTNNATTSNLSDDITALIERGAKTYIQALPSTLEQQQHCEEKPSQSCSV